MTKTLNAWHAPLRQMATRTSVPLSWQVVWYLLAIGVGLAAVFLVGGQLMATSGGP